MRIFILLVATMFSLNGFLSAGEVLDINGSFNELKNGLPAGWSPNKPAAWDDEGTIAVNPIDGTEKQALQVTSQTKAMHLFYGKSKWPVATGDQCVIKAMVKGKGEGELGIYTYPGGGLIKKLFQATEDWTEFVAELTIPKSKPEIDEIYVVIMASPGASVEFSDVRAEIVK
jgi:hypothetical protein